MKAYQLNFHTSNFRREVKIFVIEANPIFSNIKSKSRKFLHLDKFNRNLYSTAFCTYNTKKSIVFFENNPNALIHFSFWKFANACRISLC